VVEDKLEKEEQRMGILYRRNTGIRKRRSGGRGGGDEDESLKFSHI
jgi:hypothetical protein